MKYDEKIRAIKLRRQGKSYNDIKTKIKVSKGTLSLWLRNIKLTPEQYKKLYFTAKQQNAYKLAKKRQSEINERKKMIFLQAKKEIPALFNNPLFIAGLMLYWAEGDKSKKFEIIKFTNSDYKMIELMMRWFRKFCGITENKFKIQLHIHELHNKIVLEKYWSKVTKIPLSQFYKTQIKPTSLQHRKNMLYNGTCSVRIYNRDLFRKINAWKINFIEKIAI
ncbi:MAG: hypothetical protein A2469_03295 [Candidatus Magasanikbacteria bacterium RIFOXYC2_FULL_40_16]|uniref:Uncharacterized protein n=3 Tax=Candidatus Magasanikiibacteriota TaxID=1752731 RepID=A0A1F6NEV5_9BACT|nr:MAG: hypothetical protein A2224_00250 [Candidatus Magasanikbacteria bacterium RIFOXYA2_FULL_40_20]OGH82462.1 MAG: hypothetical protein A2373_04105 [Candidatus Magasanikbacteria bacterium RIFOXYB1_FULL_40_15]OGH87266.1 MAG: hypothetical protein A2206_03040 [Candidatus Magasanikbacteria bacterium RIFOXYA1_FULL_40_8]OGH89837.1 MAG: hypothetical protein A2469_03295 [Candidatus Magasanikbacteria bacterium RIFOXYC2_FULL_40_16]OGU15124.1 MAG: hypothetical protein A2X63_09590 [Ignavibacteria bacteri